MEDSATYWNAGTAVGFGIGFGRIGPSAGDPHARVFAENGKVGLSPIWVTPKDVSVFGLIPQPVRSRTGLPSTAPVPNPGPT
jgi:hypothetical protein